MLDDDEEDDLEDEGWRISREMMDRLDNSDWLRKELADGGLRQIIAEIDAADTELDGKEKRQRKRPRLGAVPEPSPREIALMKAKHTNPKFANFVDRLLVSSGVLVEGEKTNEEDIASLLLGDGNEQLGMLSLAPIVKKRSQNIEMENSMEKSDADSGSNDASSDCSDDDSSSSVSS